jgi:hypothetical protein
MRLACDHLINDINRLVSNGIAFNGAITCTESNDSQSRKADQLLITREFPTATSQFVLSSLSRADLPVHLVITFVTIRTAQFQFETMIQPDILSAVSEFFSNVIVVSKCPSSKKLCFVLTPFMHWQN